MLTTRGRAVLARARATVSSTGARTLTCCTRSQAAAVMVGERRRRVDARRVDQDVDRPERARPRSTTSPSARVGQVGDDGVRSVASGRGLHRGGELVAAGVHAGDRVARAANASATAQPDAARGAGDQDVRAGSRRAPCPCVSGIVG